MVNKTLVKYEKDNDLKSIIGNIEDKDKISISYLQKTFAIGYIKANRIFKDLVNQGLISTDGKVIKDKINPDVLN